MTDPEVVFLIHQGTAKAIYYRNAYAGTEHATVEGHFGDVPVKPWLQRHLDSFASMWFRNLREQGFFERAKELSQQEQEHDPEITR